MRRALNAAMMSEQTKSHAKTKRNRRKVVARTAKTARPVAETPATIPQRALEVVGEQAAWVKEVAAEKAAAVTKETRERPGRTLLFGVLGGVGAGLLVGLGLGARLRA